MGTEMTLCPPLPPGFGLEVHLPQERSWRFSADSALRFSGRLRCAMGVSLSYCLFAGLVGSFFATQIFRSSRRRLVLQEACAIPFTGAAL